MSTDEWGSSRLEDMSRRVTALADRYDQMAVRLSRLDERDVNATQERADIRQGMKDITVEMRMVLAQIDKSCAEKVEGVGRRVDESAEKVLATVRQEIGTQITLALAGQADKRRWPSKDRAMITLSTLAVVGSILTAVIK